MKNKIKKNTNEQCVMEECPFNKLMESSFMQILIDTTSKNLSMMKTAALREDEKEVKLAFVNMIELMIDEYNKKYRNINLINEVQT